MRRRPRRARQWLSETQQLILPGDGRLVRITVEVLRPTFDVFHRAAPSDATAWAVTATLWMAGQGAVRQRHGRSEVSIRLDRVLSTLNVELVSKLQLDWQERLEVWRMFLSRGWSDDVAGQHQTLRWFAGEAIAGIFPAVRIVTNHDDLGRLATGIEAHPRQVVIQMFALVSTLLAKSQRQPRGRKAKESLRFKLIATLASMADAFIRAGGPAVDTVRTAAIAAGYVPGRRGLSHLQLVQFLVDRALQRRWNTSLGREQTDSQDFAKTYLYPQRARLAGVAQKAAVNPILIQKFFGFELPG